MTSVFAMRALPAALLASGLGSAVTAGAQEQAAQQSSQIQEVVVSARRQEQSLQEVPMSVAVFSSEELEMRSIEKGTDLMTLMPNVIVAGGNRGTGNTEMSIRGIPGVGTYIDGVYQSNTGLNLGSLVEMERVELLRGPQGTLFGRDTNGGAIQFVTKRPAKEFGARVRADFGSYDKRDLEAAIDLPLTDTLFSKLTVGKYYQDGSICSLVVPWCFGGKDNGVYRAELLWEPSSSFDLRLVGTKANVVSSGRRQALFNIPNHRDILVYNIAAQNPAFGLPFTEFSQRSEEPGFPGGRVGENQTTSDAPKDSIVIDTDMVYAIANWKITDNLTLESLTSGYKRFKNEYVDQRAVEVTVLLEDRDVDEEKTFTQEFHLLGSNFGGRLTWLGGLYYQQTKTKNAGYRWSQTEFFLPNPLGPQFPALVNTAMVNYVRANGPPSLATWSPSNIVGANLPGSLSGTEIEDYAVFGEIYFDITANLELTLGGRYSDKNSTDVFYQRTDGFRPYSFRTPIVGDMFGGIVTGKEKEPNVDPWFTPKIVLSYDWSSDVMFYASYAEGFTSAEINFVDAALVGLDHVMRIELDPEVIKSYEVGWHSEWFNRSLRFNGAFFLADWEGIRIQAPLPDPTRPGEFLPSPITLSAGTARAKGLEAEVLFVPNADWRFDLSVGLLDAQYKDVGVGIDIVPGQKFPFASDYSYTTGVQYNLPLAGGSEVTFRTDYRYVDDFVTHSRRSAQIHQEGFGLLSARVSYTPGPANWSVYAYGTNLTDERYVSGGAGSGADGGAIFRATMGAPRELGLGLRLTFD